MKRNNLWLIPLAFFLICCVLDIVGCMTCVPLERCIKPALMPLLCVTSFVWLLGNASSFDTKAAFLLLCGQLFGFAGDTALMGHGFAFFAGGIALFLIGHIFYITLFGRKSLKGLKPWNWAVAAASGLGASVCFAILIGAQGVLIIPMGIYACALMMLIFSTLMGVIRFGGLTWWLLLCGACLFTFSDSLIAVKSFVGISPFMDGFVIMFTYLLAQGLIAVGALRLIVQKPEDCQEPSDVIRQASI